MRAVKGNDAALESGQELAGANCGARLNILLFGITPSHIARVMANPRG